MNKHNEIYQASETTDQDLAENRSTEVASTVEPQISFLVKITLVAFVYTLQGNYYHFSNITKIGIAFEFLSQTVYVMLIVKQASNEQLAIFSLMQYPWCFKLFWAPLQDAYFIAYCGRRKTWILASYIGLSLIWGYFSLNIQNMVDNLKIDLIAFVGMMTSLLLAIQDVSMDGWMVKLSENDSQLSKFSWWCSFGYSLGGTISFNLFTWFSSSKWCQEILGIDAFLNAEVFVIAVAITFVIQGSVVFFVPEVKDSIELQMVAPIQIREIEFSSLDSQNNKVLDGQTKKFEQLNDADEVLKVNGQKNQKIAFNKQSTLIRVLHKLRQFTKNKNLMFLLLFLAFNELGFAYFDNLGPVEMFENGMNQNVYAFIWFISIFQEALGGYCVAAYGQNREMKFYLVGCIIRIVNSGFQWYIISALQSKTLEIDNGVILYGVQQNIEGIADAINYVSIIKFCLRICDSEVEGSYLAILTSVFYFASIWTTTLTFYLTSYFNHNQLSFLSLTYEVLFLLFIGRRILKLEKLKKEEWALKEK